jgi:hypothetical protein
VAGTRAGARAESPAREFDSLRGVSRLVGKGAEQVEGVGMLRPALEKAAVELGGLHKASGVVVI